MISACFLTDSEIASAPEIERVECPTCDQRGHRELDCICCGGIGWVDVDQVLEIVEEELSDRSFDGRPVAGFLLCGVYCFEHSTFIVREDRTAIDCTEQADALWRKTRAATRWGIWAFLRSLMQIRRGAA